MNYLLKHACILPSRELCDFCVIDGIITENKEALKKTSYEQIDLDGRMVLKGFCDIHTHLDKALLGRGKDGAQSLTDAIRKTYQCKAEATEESIYQRASEAAAMCYSHGTGFLRTHVDVDTIWGLKAIRALTRVKQEWKGRMDMQIVAFPQEGIVDSRENYRLLEAALLEGADLIGGIPAADTDPKQHIDMIFDLAEQYDVDIDMHVDETDDPDSLTIQYLTEQTVAHGWQNRVTAGHCCSLAANEPALASHLLAQAAAAGVGLVSLPSTNLFLQGRGDSYNIRRGIAPIAEALKQGVLVCVASDNMQDLFNPFGSGKVLNQAWLAANCCHMGTREAMEQIFYMITEYPARILGIRPWLYAGDPADFVILNSKSMQEAIAENPGLFGRFVSGIYSKAH